MNKFLRIYKLDPREVTVNDVRKHLENLHKWGKADNTINVHLNALKFFYEKVLNKKLTVKINHKRIRKTLPTFLTQEETCKLFQAIKNPKHLLMVKLLYATGMRVSEFVNLKVQDFEFNNDYGWIRNGKGGKERIFVLSKKLKSEVLARIGLQKLNSNDWLFPSYGKRHYSTSSMRNIINKATKEAKIKKSVHPHTLRHSFATHLIENGYAITEVQPLLGHNNLNTTMIYLHMASPQILKVESPYDSLNENSTC